MAFYKHNKEDNKKSGDGLAITEWNTLSSAVGGHSGLHLAVADTDSIGIGIKVPEAKLDVKGKGTRGTVVFRGTNRASHFYYGDDEGTFIRGGKEDSKVVINDNGGNVGIGVRNPSEKLEVNGKLKLSATDSSLHFSANKVKQFITFGTWGNNAYGIGVQSYTQYFRSHSDFAWFKEGQHADDRHDPGTGGTALMVLTGGNLGIGTASPTEKLHVSGKVKATHFIGDGSGLTNLNLGSTGTYSGKKPVLYFNDANKGIFYSAKARGSSYQSWTTSGPNDGPVLFGYSDVALGTTAGGKKITLYANRDGNVGIGTASPGDKLHVNGTLRLSAGSNYARMAVEDVPGSGKGKGLTLYLRYSHHGGNSSRKLLWNGDNNWDSVSDKSMKTNIVNEKGILKRLIQLDVKNYHWKDEPDKKTKMIGFVSQDVQPLFPELVGETIDDQTKKPLLTLNYANFGVLAVGAIKELKLEHDMRIAALEEEIAGLKKKLDAR